MELAHGNSVVSRECNEYGHTFIGFKGNNLSDFLLASMNDETVPNKNSGPSYSKYR